MTISDAQGNLHANDGKFTHKPVGVDNSANQTLGDNAPVTYRSLETVIHEPLTMEELGYRTDNEGRVTARMALKPQELNTESDEAWDAMGRKFAGEHGYLLANFDFKPVSVNERSEIVCDVSSEIILDDDPSDQDLAKYHAGKLARAEGVPTEPVNRYNEPIFDASLAAAGDSDQLHPVPELPEGFKEPMIELGYNKHTDDPEIRLHWKDSVYKHCPSVDGVSDSYGDSHFGRPITDEQKEMIDEYAWALGRNLKTVRDQAVSNLERSDKFQEAVIARITAGGTNKDYI